MRVQFDIIVVGAGHAGCEAAMAAARLGSKTLLITQDMSKVAQMSCNPAVGGIAKGQIVREIDALGGQMGIITDATAIQFRMLNRSKGPAMWSPRAQSDRMRFSEAWRLKLEQQDNLYMWQDEVANLTIKDGKITGLRTKLQIDFFANSVILCNGTFLGGLMHFGGVKLEGGRIGEPASFGLSEQLKSYGFTTDRMKTGTPVRIDGRTIDFSLCTEQKGEYDFHRFSYLDTPRQVLEQRSCFLLYTNADVHDVLRQSLDQSPLYNGTILSIGPRYCPSIETKIHCFPDKDMHQLFLEPEGEHTTEYYINGFSSSLPIDVQMKAIRLVPALRDVHVFRPGYAIEYDFFDPRQLKHTLETKLIDGLFFAGQINGTTGYEEAAGQGLIAGINAHNYVHSLEPFVLKRDEAYIGVLIDDLVSKGVDEPYRMFTSRAEYRILLRQDDADMRLTAKSYEIGLADSYRMDYYRKKEKARDELIDFIANYSLKPALINEQLEARNMTPLRQGMKMQDLLLRPQLGIQTIADMVPALARRLDTIEDRREEIVEAAEILIKYEGYIKREKQVAEKINRLESVRLSSDLDYHAISSLSTEARQKLSERKPETLADASRIPGISPHDLAILLTLCGR